MKNKTPPSLYHKFETKFERICEFFTMLFGNSIVFLVVFIIVVGWFVFTLPNDESIAKQIHSIFIGFSFLAFFLIQRTMNKYNKALQVKINELIRAHDNASNELMQIETKTDHEIEMLSKEFHENKD